MDELLILVESQLAVTSGSVPAPTQCCLLQFTVQLSHQSSVPELKLTDRKAREEPPELRAPVDLHRPRWPALAHRAGADAPGASDDQRR